MRASEFIVEDKIQKGINIRVDGDIDYAGLIADGKKRYETRNTNSLKPYIGKTVAIVRTGKGSATAIGEVTIGKPIVADETTFKKLQKHHLVPSGSKFDITQGGIKYLYPMLNPRRWEEEKPVTHHGIVARQVQWESLNEYDEQSTGKLITHGDNQFKIQRLEPGDEEYADMKVSVLDDWGNEAGFAKFASDGKDLDPRKLKVHDRYRGQGFAKLIYDFMKDKGYRIIRSWDQTKYGEDFWNKNRGKDVRVWEGFFDRFFKPKLKFNFSEAGEELYCDVTLGKETVANFTFDRIGDDLEAQDMNVVAKFRGQGIAKRVYDMLKAKGFIIHRSPHQTDDGKRFWDKNRGVGSKVWESDQ